jgi:hypothetical protein
VCFNGALDTFVWFNGSGAERRERERGTSEGVKCSPNRRPYHVLLTAQSTTYQDWQARIMYHHFKKQQKLNPCTEMVNFTRCEGVQDFEPLPSGVSAWFRQIRAGRTTAYRVVVYDRGE